MSFLMHSLQLSFPLSILLLPEVLLLHPRLINLCFKVLFLAVAHSKKSRLTLRAACANLKLRVRIFKLSRSWGWGIFKAGSRPETLLHGLHLRLDNLSFLP
jgi:hypothetical protein